MDFGDAVALCALMMSIYATFQTIRFNLKQNSLIESQERLNNLLLEKEFIEADSDRKANLGASFVKLGNNKHRLKIWNKGKAAARNVRIEFPEDDHIVMKSDVEEKFPLEELEQFQSVELIAVVAMGTKRKHVVVLRWDDNSGGDNEKTLYPTI